MIAPRPVDDGVFVLQEFRLCDGASRADADGILAAADPEGLPLLTSIADDRDVASVRSSPSPETPDDPFDRASLRDLVVRWEAPRVYRRRISESALVAPAAYRLAVTESGINDGHRPLTPVTPASRQPERNGREEPTPVALLWIGAPVGTHAGLLVLVGEVGRSGIAQDPAWPGDLGGKLGIRVYRGQARD